MSEEKRFKDRVSEFPNRYRAEIVQQTPNQMIMDLYRSNGTISQEGSVINADLFNEFDESIKQAVSKAASAEEKSILADNNAAEAKGIAESASNLVNDLSETVGQLVIDAAGAGATVTVGGVEVTGLSFTSDPQGQLDQKLDKSLLFDLIYPVDSIYISMSPANPGTLFGGTWERWGKGRVPLSQSDSDVDFKIAGNIGGDKNFQSHNHCLQMSETTNLTGSLAFKTYSSSPTPSGVFVETWSDSGVTPSGTNKDKNIKVDFNGNHKHDGVTDYHGTGQGNNMPPYIVCYMWRRKS